MTFQKLKSYFISEEKIAELLNYLSENYFDVIDKIKEDYIADIISTPDELKETKRILQGMISSLEPIYSKSLSLKKQEEYRYYVLKKEKCEKDGTKFTDGSTTVEAKDFVRNYRDVRDIIRGYLNSASGLYYDIRDTLDRMRIDYSKTKENN